MAKVLKTNNMPYGKSNKSIQDAAFKMKGNPMQRNFGIGSPMKDGEKGSHDHPHLSAEDERMLNTQAAIIKKEMQINDPKARNLEAISAAQSYISEIKERLQYADE